VVAAETAVAVVAAVAAETASQSGTIPRAQMAETVVTVRLPALEVRQ
jgi:hypothetical protein